MDQALVRGPLVRTYSAHTCVRCISLPPHLKPDHHLKQGMCVARGSHRDPDGAGVARTAVAAGGGLP